MKKFNKLVFNLFIIGIIGLVLLLIVYESLGIILMMKVPEQLLSFEINFLLMIFFVMGTAGIIICWKGKKDIDFKTFLILTMTSSYLMAIITMRSIIFLNQDFVSIQILWTFEIILLLPMVMFFKRIKIKEMEWIEWT